MTSADAPFLSSPSRPATTAARVWNLLVALDVIAALVIQLWVLFAGGADANSGAATDTVGVGTSLVRLFSFFTIQSNILVLAVAITLLLNPLRDGAFWRVVHLDALLGITITGLVFDFVLIHQVHLTGWSFVATVGFHYVAPWAFLLGWLLFGPRPRLDAASMGWCFVWPIAWVVYTFIRGAIVHWYPYPFLNVDDLGFWPALRNTSLVLVVAVVLLAIFKAIDRLRTVGRRR